MKVKDFFQTFDVNPISADPMHGPMTQELIEYIQQRNEEKRQKSIEFLGDKWLLHPNNQKQKEAR
jgi:hypothetical protein